MCCFSRHVELVSDTNIFARPSKDGRQFLVYSMIFKSDEELAMILPIPTPKDVKDDAVKFINLEKYDTFFSDLRSGFPVPKSRDGALSLGQDDGSKKLKVVDVGSFVASFVPTVKDFSRLDERFRLPTQIWNQLPQYKEWGFAVFQLKKGTLKVHPMAFEFPRKDTKKIFFPTVHIHDGTVPKKAEFDHMLFCQGCEGDAIMAWEESPGLADSFMKKHDKSEGIIDPKAHVHRKIMKGSFDNKDVLV